MGAPYIVVVVANRLFDQTVFTGIERFEYQGLVIAACNDIDYIDVLPRQDVLVVRLDACRTEFPCALRGKISIEIANRDQVAQGRALPAR